MALAVFICVVLAIGIWVVAPVVREGGWARRTELSMDPDELRRKRDNALCGLRDLEMDLEMDRIEKSEYQVARKEYEREAAAAIRSLEALGLEGEEA